MELAPAYPVATARLLLRPLSAADIDALVAYRSLEEVCRFVPFEPMSAEVVTNRLREGWCRRTIAAEGSGLREKVDAVPLPSRSPWVPSGSRFHSPLAT